MSFGLVWFGFACLFFNEKENAGFTEGFCLDKIYSYCC